MIKIGSNLNEQNYAKINQEQKCYHLELNLNNAEISKIKGK